MRIGTLAVNALSQLNVATNRTFVLPLLVLYATGRCNSRCLSCEWWRSDGRDELTLGEIDELCGSMRTLGTRLVLLSGGEPLLRRDLFEIAGRMRAAGARLWLLTSGVLLARHADAVARSMDRVTISLDAADRDLYAEIRGLDGLPAMTEGVAALKARSTVPITARATLHRLNFHQLPLFIDKARALGLDGISFLAADLSSTAFNRVAAGADARPLGLERAQVLEFERLVDRTCRSHAEDFASGFVQQSPAALARLPQYYGALLGDTPFPPVACNAPWVSVVIEASGAVRPCYFHPPVGNLRDRPLVEILQKALPPFRRGLRVDRNATCERCVCSLRIGWRTPLF